MTSNLDLDFDRHFDEALEMAIAEEPKHEFTHLDKWTLRIGSTHKLNGDLKSLSRVAWYLDLIGSSFLVDYLACCISIGWWDIDYY